MGWWRRTGVTKLPKTVLAYSQRTGGWVDLPVDPWPQPIEAYRVYRVSDGAYHSLFVRTSRAYKPDHWYTAKCGGCVPAGHGKYGGVPSPLGTCGFYALKDVGRTYRGSWWEAVVRVELAGRIIEHERGYRAQKLRIVEVVHPAIEPEEYLDVPEGLYNPGMPDEPRLRLAGWLAFHQIDINRVAKAVVHEQTVEVVIIDANGNLSSHRVVLTRDGKRL